MWITDGPCRSPTLDVFRGVAILLVLGRHMDAVPSTAPPALRLALEGWRRGGWIGVDLFFVLSGFLIAGLLFREYDRSGRLDLSRFFARRALRIYPPFLALLLTVVAIQLFRPDWVAAMFSQPLSIGAVLLETFFLQNYGPCIVGHTWSLAVEEHFYIVLPLLLLGVAARGSADPFRRLAFLLPIVALAVLDLRVLNGEFYPYRPKTHLFPTHLRIDSLLFGVGLAYAWHYHGSRLMPLLTRWRLPLALLGFLLLAPAFVYSLEEHEEIVSVGLTSFALGSALLVGAALAGHFPDNAVTRAVAWIGGISYSVYLWHGFGKLLPDWLAAATGADLPYATKMLLYFGGSLGMGALAAALIERPALKLRDWLIPSDKTSGPASDLALSRNEFLNPIPLPADPVLVEAVTDGYTAR